jgi:hypothetical protein
MVVLFAAVTIWIFWRDPVTALAAELSTEIIEIEVTNPDAAAFALPYAVAEGETTCLQGLVVTPGRAARVNYERRAREGLAVQVEGTSIWEHGPADRRVRERREGQVMLHARGPACSGSPASSIRLPVNGIVKYGRALPQVVRPEDRPATLLSGHLTVYAHALPDLFTVPLEGGPFQRNALYLAQQVPIPGGTIIASAISPQRNPAEPGAAPRWAGFADVGFGGEDPAAIAVSTTTNTGRVHGYLPSPNVAGGRLSDPEVVSLSLLARITGDPHLQLIYGVLAVFALMLTAYVDFRDAVQSREVEDDTVHVSTLAHRWRAKARSVRMRILGALGRRRAGVGGRRT